MKCMQTFLTSMYIAQKDSTCLPLSIINNKGMRFSIKFHPKILITCVNWNIGALLNIAET